MRVLRRRNGSRDQVTETWGKEGRRVWNEREREVDDADGCRGKGRGWDRRGEEVGHGRDHVGCSDSTLRRLYLIIRNDLISYG